MISSLPYCLQIQSESGWVSICRYDEGHLEDALSSCRRAVFVEKVAARVIEREDDDSFILVLELFYNIDDDPEARDWDDDDWYEDEGFEISWKDCGF